MAVNRTVPTKETTGTGIHKDGEVVLDLPAVGVDRTMAVIGVLQEQVSVGAFTDGGSTSGTYVMAGSLPKGAIVIGSKLTVEAGFAGDTSAVLTVGDGTDVDRYMTGTPDVFATAADGIQSGLPSGTKLLTAENNPTMTITSAVDFGSVTPGTLTFTIYYIETQ